jgi:hypothetical protein
VIKLVCVVCGDKSKVFNEKTQKHTDKSLCRVVIQTNKMVNTINEVLPDIIK